MDKIQLAVKEKKLIYLLGLLSPHERRNFRRFVASPIFNEREVMPRLLAALEKHGLEPESDTSPEEIYQSLYGSEREYNEGSLKTSMSQLLVLLLDFLSFSKFREKEMVKQRYLLEKLRDMGEARYFTYYWGKAMKSIKKSSDFSFDRYYEMMRLEELRMSYARRQPEWLANERGANAEENLKHSFIIRTLHHQLRLSSEKIASRAGSTHSLSGAVLTFVEKEIDRQPVPVRIYYEVLQALKHPQDEKQFSKALEQLPYSLTHLAPMEAEDLYTSVLNCAVRRVTDGQTDSILQVYQLYLQMLDNRIILERGRISDYHFKNIVNAALRLHEFDWVEKFIANWQDKVEGDYAQNAYHYNQGQFKFYKGQFEEAALHFNQVLDDFKDVFYGLNSRGYLLQINFEMGDMLALESLAHSTRMYLSRNKEVSRHKRKTYLLFINHLHRLINIPPGRTDKLRKLYQELMGKEVKGMGIDWLREKIQTQLGEKEGQTTP